ncbi:hypothetical protein O181_072367 [Austropuccinia psidii MF-1]|uniref:Uncharacterized protein n=1 Tax=Austropuccinia psidii MF-1 TaxID=1389203 RepID=A0A9Q3F9E4_9BASI|nr:hypothetical protein [Austropuccinia psidii MF-1]
MTHTLIYHSIQNVQLCHHHVGREIGPYARAHTHAYAHAPAPAPVHANAIAPHPQYCVADSTSVIQKIAILQRKSPFMDGLVKSNPPLHQNWLKDLFDVCVWKQAGLV